MTWLQALVAIAVGLLSSTGVWALVSRRTERKDARDKLLMGVAYEKILTMGMGFISRGWLTHDEYEDYRRYLYEPYLKMGGNGTASRVMAAVDDLPLRPRAEYKEVIQEAKRSSDSEYPSAELASAA